MGRAPPINALRGNRRFGVSVSHHVPKKRHPFFCDVRFRWETLSVFVKEIPLRLEILCVKVAARQWKAMAVCTVVPYVRLCLNYLNVYGQGDCHGKGVGIPTLPRYLPFARRSSSTGTEMAPRYKGPLQYTAVPTPWLCLRYLCVTRCLTNHGLPASLSSRTDPELPTEILPRRKRVSFFRT